MDALTMAIKKRTSRQFWFWWILLLTVVGGWRYPLLGYFLPLCMLAGMGSLFLREDAGVIGCAPGGALGIFF